MRKSALLFLAAFAGSAAAVSAPASQDGFIALGGGLNLPNGEIRDLTGSKYGMHLNLGLGAWGTALVGFPTFEFDWGHVTGKGNRLDTVNMIYCERVMLQEGVYIGGGAGTSWIRLVRQAPLVEGETVGGDDSKENTFNFCLRGMIGMTVFRQFYIEGAAFYNGNIDGVDANALAVLAGVRF